MTARGKHARLDEGHSVLRRLVTLLGVSLLSGSMLSAQDRSSTLLEPITAIIDAFAVYPLVALGEQHGSEQEHSLRLQLIRDPRFASTVDDIVVEFGNALYQDVIDRFVRGEVVDDAVLRQVWQNTTAAHTVWDRPIYEEFFRAVRQVNLSKPTGRQLRILLGDPPIDWANIRSAETSPMLSQRLAAIDIPPSSRERKSWQRAERRW